MLPLDGLKCKCMKIVILQTDIVRVDPASNICRAESILDKYDKVDLFILPEMFSTGYCVNPDGMKGNAINYETLEWMKTAAKKRECAIAGSVICKEEGRFYNRFYFVHPEGIVEYYDKKHLFTYGGENNHFTAGNKRVVVNYKGVRFLLQVCYDLRFPVWSRNHGDYDVAVYVASWPSTRVDAWSLLLKARAVENQCYVIGVNRVGKAHNCDYSGGSAVISPYGKVVAECEDNKACEAVVELDMSELEEFRMKFPVLNDADSFEIV